MSSKSLHVVWIDTKRTWGILYLEYYWERKISVFLGKVIAME